MGEFINKLAKWKEFTLDLLFPKNCIGCSASGSFLCQKCSRKLPYLSPLNCPKCGLPLGSKSFCPRCDDRVWNLDGLHSVFRFENVLRQAILQLKYNNYRALAPFLADYVCAFLKTTGMKADAIIPVPLHPHRIKERGYNQSSLIASHVSKLTGIPLLDNHLLRIINTIPQVRTSNREERINNVKNAFACRKQELKINNVIIFDDVCTTGATLNACAAALKTAGIKPVYGLTLAREI